MSFIFKNTVSLAALFALAVYLGLPQTTHANENDSTQTEPSQQSSSPIEAQTLQYNPSADDVATQPVIDGRYRGYRGYRGYGGYRGYHGYRGYRPYYGYRSYRPYYGYRSYYYRPYSYYYRPYSYYYRPYSYYRYGYRPYRYYYFYSF